MAIETYMQGSCGYGVLDKSKYPYWSVGALSTSNMYYAQGPVQGCGYVQACFVTVSLQVSMLQTGIVRLMASCCEGLFPLHVSTMQTHFSINGPDKLVVLSAVR